MQAGSAQPNSHSIPRTSSSLPSMAHVACALRWKLNDARREIAAAEPLAKASNGCFCAHAAAAQGAAPPAQNDCGLPPPPLLEFPPPAPPSIYLCAIYIPVFPLRYQRDLSRLSALLADYTGTVQKSKKSLRKALPTACQKQLIGDPEAYTYTLENCSA